MIHGPFSSCVFDLDGTLVDSIPGIEASVSAAIAEVAPRLSAPSLRTFIGPPIRTMLERALAHSPAHGLLGAELLEYENDRAQMRHDRLRR